jgi:hypothetical protein
MPVLTLGLTSLLSRPPVLLRGPVHMVTLPEIGRLLVGRIILDKGTENKFIFGGKKRQLKFFLFSVAKGSPLKIMR